MATQQLKLEESQGWQLITGFTKGSNASGQNIEIVSASSLPAATVYGHSMSVGGNGIDASNLSSGNIYAICRQGSAILVYETE